MKELTENPVHWHFRKNSEAELAIFAVLAAFIALAAFTMGQLAIYAAVELRAIGNSAGCQSLHLMYQVD